MRAAKGYLVARERARRRKSPWNLLLAPLGLAGGLGVWYGSCRLVWAFHVSIYPEHRLEDCRRRIPLTTKLDGRRRIDGPSNLAVFSPECTARWGERRRSHDITRCADVIGALFS